VGGGYADINADSRSLFSRIAHNTFALFADPMGKNDISARLVLEQ
jgi:hypothetical protein